MTFLIVMQNRITAMDLDKHLEGKKITSNDENAARRILEIEEIDVLIVESGGLSKISGENLSEKAKLINPATMVILITTDTEEEEKKYFDACFQMPICAEEFEKKIYEFIKS